MPKTITVSVLGVQELPDGSIKPHIDIILGDDWEPDEVVGVMLTAYEKLAEQFMETHKCIGGEECHAMRLHRGVVVAKREVLRGIRKNP